MYSSGVSNCAKFLNGTGIVNRAIFLNGTNNVNRTKIFNGSIVGKRTKFLYGSNVVNRAKFLYGTGVGDRAINIQLKKRCAAGAAINMLIIVRSKNSMNSSGRFTGIFEPRISPPTSDR